MRSGLGVTLGLCYLSDREQRCAEGQAASVMLAVEFSMPVFIPLGQAQSARCDSLVLCPGLQG